MFHSGILLAKAKGRSLSVGLGFTLTKAPERRDQNSLPTYARITVSFSGPFAHPFELKQTEKRRRSAQKVGRRFHLRKCDIGRI